MELISIKTSFFKITKRKFVKSDAMNKFPINTEFQLNSTDYGIKNASAQIWANIQGSRRQIPVNKPII